MSDARQAVGTARSRIDRELSPSGRARDAPGTLAAYRTRSAAARGSLAYRADIAYGPHPAERLHHFPPRRAGAPLVVFVHGGHWLESSKEDACFAAPALVGAGAGYVALGYGLAPERPLTELSGSVELGLAWVREHAVELGGRPDAVFAAGSSAGAHLVAMAAGGPDGLPLAGLFLLSGLYDLEPVVGSYVNDALGLTAGQAREQSPLFRAPPRGGRVLLARGEHETDEYARQQDAFAAMLRGAVGGAGGGAGGHGGRESSGAGPGGAGGLESSGAGPGGAGGRSGRESSMSGPGGAGGREGQGSAPDGSPTAGPATDGRAMCGLAVDGLVVRGRDHFDLPFDLGDPTTVLGRAVLDRLGLAH
ncbi:alpha/beta hydrolase [Streptomyces uncialis]|uniref:alpha/beta hydrolase n=1 Tax=Streptomyces uncialis TaxID=1048205 RepID=UPI003863A87D|nr:alpha/beta hydrolase [Streptomyces uncialis]